MKDTTLSRTGGFAAFAVGILSILYAVAYLIIAPAAQRGADTAAWAASMVAAPGGMQLAGLCFVLSGVLGSFVVAAVSERLRPVSEGWARWSLAVGVLALAATGVHGLWNIVLTPRLTALYVQGDAATRAAVEVFRNVPVPIDPKEFFTFAMTGLWAVMLGVLTLRGAALPRWLGYVAVVAGVDMLLLFCADVAGSQVGILATGGLASLILGPAMWIGIGMALLRPEQMPAGESMRMGAARA